MYEMDDIVKMEEFKWEVGHSCVHVWFKDGTVWCSNMGPFPVELG